MAQRVMGDGGFYIGNSTSRITKASAQLARVVMASCGFGNGLGDGNSYSNGYRQRTGKITRMLFSTAGTRGIHNNDNDNSNSKHRNNNNHTRL